jgi:diguanylate cyclase (GGDEF)-like protein
VISNAFEDACIDGLTGLLNKKAITRYAEKAIENAGKNGHQVAFAMMDVDNFKSVNDNFGHLFGDKVIKAVGDVIKYAIGTDAVAGRMGGDEFLIVFERFDDELEYRNVLRCIKTKVNYVYANKFTGSNKLSCSIGLGRYGIGCCSSTYNDLFKIADKALYLAKQKGKNRYIIYKPELHGDFNSPSDSGDDTVKITRTYYSDEDIDKLNSLISDTIVYGSEVIGELIDKLASVLMLDRVNVFTGSRAIPAFANTVTAGSDKGFSNPSVLGDAQYLSIFNKNKMVISNIHGIEYTLPETFKKFSDEGIGSLMQYVMVDRNGKVAGLVTAEIFEKFTSFPKIAIQIFEITCRTINSVLIREGRI